MPNSSRTEPSVKAVVFRGGRDVGVETLVLSPPAPLEVQVRARCSAISAGTELLAYRGQIPTHLAIDPHLPAHAGSFAPPFRYGYALVGEIVALGEGVVDRAVGQRVFAFAPHVSALNLQSSDVIPLPDALSDERALFIPSLETALSLVQDGQPVIGDRVLIFGQGVVGLLTTCLLAKFPLAELVVVEPDRARAALARACGGARVKFQSETELADLVFELSGNPRALQTAIERCAVEGLVIVGSWYGDKPVQLELGSHFHRARVRVQSSQVSQIAGALRPRWTQARRLQWVVQLLGELTPEAWISQRFPIEQVAQAYRLLDEDPAACLQVVLTYA